MQLKKGEFCQMGFKMTVLSRLPLKHACVSVFLYYISGKDPFAKTQATRMKSFYEWRRFCLFLAVSAFSVIGNFINAVLTQSIIYPAHLLFIGSMCCYSLVDFSKLQRSLPHWEIIVVLRCPVSCFLLAVLTAPSYREGCGPTSALD